MKRFSSLLFAGVLASLTGSAGVVRAQSQIELNLQLKGDFEEADAELNRVYKKLIATLDAEGQDKLKAAQRAWIVFRDAQAAFDADNQARGGSASTMIYFSTRAQLTRERTKQLKQISQ